MSSNNLVGIFKKLGKLAELKTQNKENLVSSINEVVDKASEVDTIKQKIQSSVKEVEAGLNYNTIKITKNDGTVENVLIKVQSGSEKSLNVFKTSQNGGSFIATEKTDTFTIEGIDETKDVDIIFNNLFLIKDVDYTLDKTNGVVGLGFELEANEVIYYIITSTSYNYNDLANIPNLGLKADKTEVDSIKSKLPNGTIATTETTSANKVLTTLEEVNNPNLESGIYSAEGEGVGMIFVGTITNYYYALIVNQHRLNAGYGSQIAIPYDGGGNGGIFYRNCRAGTWNSWSELNTSSIRLVSNIDILAYASSITVGETVTIRGYGVSNSPMGQSDNDGYYTIYSTDVGHASIIAKDIRSNAVYLNTELSGTWTGWQPIATIKSGIITLNGFTQSFTQCRVSKVGNTYTFNFSIVTTGGVPSGTVIATLPVGFYPYYDFHIPTWAHNVDVPNYVRAWVTTDGNIGLHGGDDLASGAQLEFSRTMIFE